MAGHPPWVLYRGPIVTAMAVFGLSFASYLVTLCPGVYTEGAGELIGATYLLGTPHPTGYPLFVLLGRVIALLLPLSPAALEINLASALLAALAAATVSGLLASRGVGRVGCLVGGLALAWGQVYWSQAVIAEVYGLFVGVTVLALTAALAAVDRPTTRRLLLAGYLCGMAVTTHLQAVLAMPVILCLMLRSLWRGVDARHPAVSAGRGGMKRRIMARTRDGRRAWERDWPWQVRPRLRRSARAWRQAATRLRSRRTGMGTSRYSS